MTRRRITPEAGVLKACTDLLSAERIWWMRLNVGAVKIGDRFIKFNRSGTADVLCTPWIPRETYSLECSPMPLWLEFKSPTGRQTQEQKAFQEEVLFNGHAYLVVRKPEQLIQWLQEHGVIA